MDNVKISKLAFNRSYVTFDHALPKSVLDELLTAVNTRLWHDHGTQANRQVLDNQSFSASVNNWFEHDMPSIIYYWTKEQVRLTHWGFWQDTGGLYYNIHTDYGMFDQHEHHIQIYLNDGEPARGTRLHSWLTRRQIAQVPYKLNSGVYLNTAQTILHSVSPVPTSAKRTSVQARYVRV